MAGPDLAEPALMFLGHVSFALGARRLRPQLPLFVLATATVLLDWVDSFLGLAGQPERVGIWTHTLPGALAWSAAVTLVGVLAWDLASGAVLGGLTLSHLLTDYLTSSLLAWPGGPRLGLHLYRFRAADFFIESALLIGCWLAYRTTLAEESRRRWSVWAILAIPLALQAVFDFATRVGA